MKFVKTNEGIEIIPSDFISKGMVFFETNDDNINFSDVKIENKVIIKNPDALICRRCNKEFVGDSRRLYCSKMCKGRANRERREKRKIQ